jgi:hypothetical protein
MNTISIIHPSRNRPEMALETCKKWIKNASKKYSIEYVVSIDETDTFKNQYNQLFVDYYLESNNEFSLRVLILDNKTSVEAINNGAKFTNNNLMLVVSDDFDCFENWDEWLINNLDGKSDYLVKTDDGFQGWIITLPIMDRAYYNRFGYIYYPEYHHMFCDTEMTDVGHLLDRVINLQDGVHKFIHKHYSLGYMQKDATNTKNDATWSQGEALYYSRKANKFNL